MIETLKRSGTPRRVLAIEDDSRNEEFLTFVLKNHGVEVLVVNSIEELQKILREWKPTEIMTDGLNGGWKTVKHIIETSPQPNLPVRLWSNNDNDVREAKERGIETINKHGHDIIGPLLTEPAGTN